MGSDASLALVEPSLISTSPTATVIKLIRQHARSVHPLVATPLSNWEARARPEELRYWRRRVIKHGWFIICLATHQ